MMKTLEAVHGEIETLRVKAWKDDENVLNLTRTVYMVGNYSKTITLPAQLIQMIGKGVTEVIMRAWLDGKIEVVIDSWGGKIEITPVMKKKENDE
jgi:hypothetical protein